MPAPNYQNTLIEAQIDGTAGTSTTENSLLPPAASGQCRRTTCTGSVSGCTQSERSYLEHRHHAGHAYLRVKFGTIAVAASAALQLNAVAKTNVFWVLEWTSSCEQSVPRPQRTSSTTASGPRSPVVGSPVPATGGAGTFGLSPVTPVVGTGFDSTVSNVVDLTQQFLAHGNSMQAHMYALESAN